MSLKFTLHVWGSIEDLASIMPDCLAAIWYVQLSLGSRVEIIQSSNKHMSKTYELPALKRGSELIAGGYQNIVSYLKRQGYDLDGDLAASTLPLNSYLMTRVLPLTLYTLFVNRDNFDKITSPLMAGMVPFPMQYNLTIGLRDWARTICTSAGLANSSKVTWSLSDEAKKNPSMSKLHEQLQNSRKNTRNRLNDAQENLRVLNVAKDVLEVIQEMKKKDEIFLFGSKPTSSDLLLAANLKISCVSVLPYPIMNTLIENQFPEFNDYLEKIDSYLEENIEGVSMGVVAGNDTFSLVNMVRYYGGMIGGWA